MFINVAAEAIPAIMIIFLLPSDEICFTWIFEQSTLVDAKIVVSWILFVVDFMDVAAAASVVITVVAIVAIDLLGICVAGTNLVIGS